MKDERLVPNGCNLGVGEAQKTSKQIEGRGQ